MGANNRWVALGRHSAKVRQAFLYCRRLWFRDPQSTSVPSRCVTSELLATPGNAGVFSCAPARLPLLRRDVLAFSAEA
jgi:hypothetical protein